MGGVCLGEGRVFTHHIERLDLAFVNGVDDFGMGQTHAVIQFAIPGGFKFLAHLRVIHALVARIDIGQSAHIACTLHVVLSAQWVDAAGGLAHVAGEQRQIADRLHVICTVRVLRDSHRVENSARLVGRIQARYRGDFLPGHAGHLGHKFRRILGQRLRKRLEIFTILADKGFVTKRFIYDHARHAHQQRGIAARAQLQESMRAPA